MDSYIYFIAALLPLVSAVLIYQTNPYRALLTRGILGAIAALMYTIMGAADVALTEALVGTLLAVTLYAIAIRSSLVIRLGILCQMRSEDNPDQSNSQLNELIADFRKIFNKYNLRLEIVTFDDSSDLMRSLSNKEVHAICLQAEEIGKEHSVLEYRFQIITRLQRLHEIMIANFKPDLTHITYSNSFIETGVLL
ncbi:DUF4040 domain-containing protein [Synechococcus elongatus IITB7]|uniref:DUF4040 domain-containing protein n=1 Tax=Synechococcus elongatus TaxID=32046 RepID=UPI0030D26703